jgi:hypothetical protein
VCKDHLVESRPWDVLLPDRAHLEGDPQDRAKACQEKKIVAVIVVLLRIGIETCGFILRRDGNMRCVWIEQLAPGIFDIA